MTPSTILPTLTTLPTCTTVTTVPTGTASDGRLDAFRLALHTLLARQAGGPGGSGPLRGARVPVRVLGLTADRPVAPPTPAEDPAALVLPVHLVGDTALIGPAHDADRAPRPCAACLRRRWLTVRPEREREALERGGPPVVAGPGSPVPAEWGVPVVAAALGDLAERWHRRTRNPGAGGRGARGPGAAGPADVLEVDLGSGAVTRFALLAHPACPDCADVRPDEPPTAHGFPRSRPVPNPGDTRLGHWSAYPLPVDALANPLCGALAAGAGFNRLSVGINAPVSGLLRLGGRTTERATLYEITWGGHADGYGESLALGLLEGLERYAGQRPLGRGPVLRAAFADLDGAERGAGGDEAAGAVPGAETGAVAGAETGAVAGVEGGGRPALDPRRTVLYPPAFYEQDHGRTLVPFRPDREMDWVWGHSFAQDGPLLVPAQLAYYGPQRLGEQFLVGSSSGCATGGCLEEAALHGLLELVERDAFTVAWYSAASLPEIAPDSCADPRTAAAIDRMRALGYQVRLFDLRLDLPFPIVLCAAVRRTPGPGNLCLSAGIDHDPEAAALTAVREVASYLPGFADRVRGVEDELRSLSADYDTLTELRQHGMLYGLPEMAAHVPLLRSRERPRPLADTFADWRRPRHTDLADQLRACVDLVREVADDVIVVEQTCPEQETGGVRTASVIAPGLVPIDFGWHYQRVLHTDRLRKAAWRAGKRAEPLAERDVHRHPHPFL
ncbi:TOMM precursor leader peptide-binding protein [Streptomyces sp. NPDC087917]|uniref:TOMM precursor leader peptide-binding protein n=1 Tax=Streptomyces sp. NPDC087917 TaxID=3155060 RepID=UPI0034162E26